MTALVGVGPALGALVLSYAVFAWVVSSAVSRGQGFAVFVALLVPLGAALLVFRRGRRTALYRVWFAGLGLTLGALAFEALLHVAPGVLAGRIADVAYTGYHAHRGGIYALDPHAGPVMRPSFERRMYWGGHWWRHRTNEDGYRGARLARADVVFLGDSMVYGHGVEEDETVPSRFQALTRLASANLGQQGTCLIRALLALERSGLRLRPRTVYVCAHFNDTEESLLVYAEDELRRFVESPAASPYRPRVRARFAPRPWWHATGQWSLRAALPLRAGGILGEAVRLWRGAGGVALRPPGSRWERPSEQDVAAPFPPLEPAAAPGERLAWAAQRRALEEIRRQAESIGADVVLFDIGWPRAFTRAAEALAGEVGVRYDPAGGAVLHRALAGEPVYLVDDGHWSPRGCALVAEELARAAPANDPG